MYIILPLSSWTYRRTSLGNTHSRMARSQLDNVLHDCSTEYVPVGQYILHLHSNLAFFQLFKCCQFVIITNSDQLTVVSVNFLGMVCTLSNSTNAIFIWISCFINCSLIYQRLCVYICSCFLNNLHTNHLSVSDMVKIMLDHFTKTMSMVTEM